MSANPRPTGRLDPRDPSWVVLRRSFPAPVDDVWAAVTDPERLGRWIGTWTGDPASGRVEFTMTAEGEDVAAETYRIEECRPPRLLAVSTVDEDGDTWRLRLELSEAHGVTALDFAQQLSDPDVASHVGPGWEYYLDRLVAAERGEGLSDIAFETYYPALSEHYRSLLTSPADARSFGDVHVELTVGDITAQHDLDAVVNAANARLETGGGVAGAIHRAAGPGLAEECRPLAPIAPGECVLTGGHDLPNPWVLHCLGPVYGRDDPADELLASCYRNALRLADGGGLRSVGFPAISTGAFGYPARQAAEIALTTVAELAPDLTTVRHVRFVLHTPRDSEVHREALRSLPR